MVVSDKLYTVTEFEAYLMQPHNADRRLELIHGEIVEKMPTEEHGLVTTNFVIPIGNFNKTHKLGRLTVETRYQLPQDEHNARMPDISFTSNERLLPLTRKGAVPQMPDLCIEIKSPDDSLITLREKAQYYLANGARLVWIVVPAKRLIEVYRPDEDVEILYGEDGLDGGEVLPGFQMTINELFVD